MKIRVIIPNQGDNNQLSNRKDLLYLSKITKDNKKFIGIVSENDVLVAYLEISDEINHIEKN